MKPEQLKDGIEHYPSPGESPVYAIACGPDSNLLAVGQEAGPDGEPTLTLLDVALETVVKVIETASATAESVYRVAFAPDGKRLVYALQTGADFQLKEYDLAARTSTVILDGEPAGLREGLAFDQSGKWLLVTGREVRLLDAETHQIKTAFRIPEVPPKDVAEFNMAASLSPNGGRVAIGGVAKGLVTIYDAQTGEVVSELEGEFGGIDRLEFDRAGRFVAALDYYGRGVFIWDLTNGQRCFAEIFNADLAPVSSLSYSPCADYLAIGHVSGYAVLYNSLTSGELYDDKLHNGRVSDICFSANGNLLISAGDDAQLFLRPLRKRLKT